MELKIDKKAGRKIVISVIVLIVLYLLLKESERVKTVYSFVWGVISPLFIGAVLAFILNVPMRFFERKMRFIKNEQILRVISICLTLLAVFAVIAAVVLLLVPQVKSTIATFSQQLPPFISNVSERLTALIEKYPVIGDFVGVEAGEDGIDWTKLTEKAATLLENSISGLVDGAFSLVSNVISGIYTAVFGFIFSFYCLARKETLARQSRKLLYSVVQEKKADEVVRVLRMSNSIFSNFIAGQCIDAVLLGVMCAIAMAILQLPYIPLICVIIVVTALIPVMGALIGGALGAFLIFVSSPMQALIFIAMFIVVQQIDNNIVYPRVVGSSIGLPGMWVLMAVLIGEGLMGVVGMLFMVPVFSVLYTLIREFATKRVEQRNVPEEKLKCQPPDLQRHFMFTKAQRAKQRRKDEKAQTETQEETTE